MMLYLVIIFSLLSTGIHADTNYHPGQHFILNPPSTKDKAILSKWLTQTKPAGIILFAGHCTQRTQTKELISFLQQKAQKLGIPPLLIAIDWEGGIVSRPNEEGGFASVPSPWALAQAGRSACFTAGMLIGQQMRSVGANINFAPSLDLFFLDNHILATRCFASDPEVVATSGIAFAKGLLTNNIIPVFKHLPGLGLGKDDTHFSSVGIVSDDETFSKNILPFTRALTEIENPVVMCTHAMVDRFGKLPITLSSEIITYVKAHNPKTLFITDDFAMKAVQENRTLEEAVFTSLTAGHHLIILSAGVGLFADTQDQLSIINQLNKKYLQLPQDQQKKLLEQQHAVNAFKQKMFKQKQTTPLLDEQKTAQLLAQQCVMCLSKNKSPIQHKKIILFSTNLPHMRQPESWFIQNNQSYLNKLLTKQNLIIEEHILNPLDETSTAAFAELIKTIPPDATIMIQTFFYTNDIRNTTQQQWLEQLKLFQDRLIIISLGHPKEATLLPQANTINLGSFHKPMLTQAVNLLCTPPVETGADLLVKNFATYLRNKRFGLLCHRASITSTHAFLPDVLQNWATQQNDKTKLAALFSPEHGLLGSQEAFAHVDSHQQSKWQCPIYSLHGNFRKPTPAMLKDLDLLIIDLQEIGTRCFTYLSTLELALNAAAENNLSLIVLDRSNPLAHWKAGGPNLEEKYKSFVGTVEVPFLHGSTIGTLAKKINQKYHAPLTVIPNSLTSGIMQPFVPPSPNLMSREHVYAYPCSVFLEGTNYSEGRGTLYPFLQWGAPWVDKQQLAQTLNQCNFSGIYFEPISFTPQRMPGLAEHPKHANQLCHGVFMHLYDPAQITPMDVAQTILKTLWKLYPEQSQLLTWGKQYALDLLAGTDEWRKSLNTERKLI